MLHDYRHPACDWQAAPNIQSLDSWLVASNNHLTSASGHKRAINSEKASTAVSQRNPEVEHSANPDSLDS